MNEPYTALMIALGTPPGGGGQGQGGGGFMMLGYMVIIFALFYFMMIRPQMRKEKERKSMIAGVKSGDRIMFSGGILGTVTNAKEHTLAVKIADNVKVEIARGAVLRVLEKGEQVGEVEETK